jgi:hypothetical protein
MSVCSTCFQSDDVPTCTSELQFGVIVTLDAVVDVFVKNLATNRIDKYDGTVDEFGVVTVEDVKLVPNLTFELWASDSQINERLTITNNLLPYKCIEFKAVKVGGNVVFYLFDLMILE